MPKVPDAERNMFSFALQHLTGFQLEAIILKVFSMRGESPDFNFCRLYRSFLSEPPQFYFHRRMNLWISSSSFSPGVTSYSKHSSLPSVLLYFFSLPRFFFLLYLSNITLVSRIMLPLLLFLTIFYTHRDIHHASGESYCSRKFHLHFSTVLDGRSIEQDSIAISEDFCVSSKHCIGLFESRTAELAV